MQNPLLEKEVWDWQDAAVAADWAMERGVFGADLWWCFPPEFVWCLAACPELLASASALQALGRVKAKAWVWVGLEGREGTRTWAGMRTGTRAWSQAWARARTRVGAQVGVGAWVRIGYSWA